MILVQSEYELPFGEYYIRCESAPRSVVGASSGEVFVRVDGRDFEHPGYRLGKGGVVPMKPIVREDWDDDDAARLARYK